jgi:uncharacterized surface protein with fasciclin (FAS1) repeats
MDNQFSFIVPTDDVLNNYLNPVSVSKPIQERWKFRYNAKTASVEATVYNALSGDSIGVASGATLLNALQDILDNHVVVGDIESGKTFYTTKGGSTIRISANKGIGMKIEGGGNMEQGIPAVVNTIYPMKNGKTYITNNMIQSPVKSVFYIMSTQSQFSEFFNLCAAAQPLEYTDGAIKRVFGGTIFSVDPSFSCIDYNVTFFNTFNYTVYVPTNQAIRNAINSGVIKTWEEIHALPTLEEQGAETQKLYNFLRYHFQDNSIYISGDPISKSFETATMNSATSKFYKITLNGSGNNLRLTTASGGTANVITNGGLYNIIARDYKFNNKLVTAATQISTSSYAVIHQIDEILKYQ